MKSRFISRRKFAPQGRRQSAAAHAANVQCAFTLVELLVSLTVLAMLLLILLSVVNQTGSIWSQTLSKVSQFREARNGFEAITRRLSQATLNTYWDYDNPTTPTKYIRQSELRFVCGPQLVGSGTSSPPRPTQAVFFQAPLGFVVPSAITTGTTYRGMENLLNSWGYYIEYNSDASFRPAFLTSPTRTRFRLMEFMQSTQDLNLYSLEVGAGGNSSYNYSCTDKGLGWFITGTSGVNTPVMQNTPVHILAENVLALVLLPKLTPATETSGTNQYTDASLAPDYSYNSGPDGMDYSTGAPLTTLSDPNLDPKNQLPPIVEVTMVAIDEASAVRLSAQQNQAILTELSSLFTKSANYSTDISGGTAPDGTQPAGGGLVPFLKSQRINYRVFTTDVSIKGAKWSTQQTN